MESAFSLEMTTRAKQTEGYAIFQTTLHAQQTPDLPPEPTNAEIYLRIVLQGPKVKVESGSK